MWRAAARAAVFAVGVGSAAAAAEPVATERGMEGTVTPDRLPVPDSPVLQAGAEVWGGLCVNCHGYDGQSGAPKITALRAWRPRLAQGLDTLFAHALEGFMGPRFTMMPARGGDPELTDDQVKAAVAFMIANSGGRAMVDAWLQTKDTP